MEKVIREVEAVTEDIIEVEFNDVKDVDDAELASSQENHQTALIQAALGLNKKAEISAARDGKNYYIANISNGLGFYPEDEYEELLEQALTNYRNLLEPQGFTKEEIEEKVDAFAANIVVRYIDFNKFSEKEVQDVRDMFTRQKKSLFPTVDPEKLLEDNKE